MPAEIIWWVMVLGRSWGKEEELWGMPASPPVPEFTVSLYRRCRDPGSIAVSGEAGKQGGLLQVSLMQALES